MTQPVHYAGFWRRLAATMIDVVLISVVMVPILMIFFQPPAPVAPGQMPAASPGQWLLDLLLAAVVIALWVRYGATPGKQLMRCKVVDTHTGSYLTVGKAVIRYFAYILSTLPLGLGFLWIAWDRRKQGFHDKLAGSVVVVFEPTDESHKSLEQLMREAQ